MLFLIRLQSSISFSYNVDIFCRPSLPAYGSMDIYTPHAHNLHKYSAIWDGIVVVDKCFEASASPKMDQLLWIV